MVNMLTILSGRMSDSTGMLRSGKCHPGSNTNDSNMMHNPRQAPATFTNFHSLFIGTLEARKKARKIPPGTMAMRCLLGQQQAEVIRLLVL
jgi:hypothetical protein